MRIDIHIHGDDEDRKTHVVLQHVVSLLEMLHLQGDRLMASFQEVSDELSAIKTAVDEVKRLDQEQIAEIASLKEQVAAGSPVTQEQLDQLDAQADSILAALQPGSTESSK